jgi:hypothetical protein
MRTRNDHSESKSLYGAGKVAPFQDANVRGLEVQFHWLLTLALDWGQGWTSWPGRFTPRAKKKPLAVGGSQNGLAFLGKKNISCASCKIKTNIRTVFKSVELSEIQSTLKRFAGGYSETAVPSYQTTRRHKPGGSNIHIQSDRNPSCHRVYGSFKWRYSVNTAWHENLAALSNTEQIFWPPQNIWSVYRKNKISKMGSIFPSALVFRTKWQLIRTC